MEEPTRFEREFEDVVTELITLERLCGLDLKAPGVMDAVLRGDQHLSGNNEAAFKKLRGLLVLSYKMVENEANYRGGEPAAKAVERAIQEITERYNRSR